MRWDSSSISAGRGGLILCPLAKSILIERLLGLNDASKPYCIMRGEDTDLVAEWKIADADWYGVLSRNGLRQAYRALLLVDEYRHSVRCCEELGSVAWTVGLNGPIPTVSYTRSFFRGRILYNKQNAVGFGLKQLEPPVLKNSASKSLMSTR
jgi:hypothetical protein